MYFLTVSKNEKFWLKPSIKLIINCHGLKAVAIQVVDAYGFSHFFFNEL